MTNITRQGEEESEPGGLKKPLMQTLLHTPTDH